MQSKPAMDIISAIRNPKLFAPLFGDLATWAAWIVFLKSIFGLPMDASELALYKKCTGRSWQPHGGVREAFVICGRRAGKSRIVAFIACFIACFLDFSQYLVRGERGMVLILARDKDQAKTVFCYIGGILNAVPVLQKMVRTWRSDEIELKNGIIVAVKTSDYRTVRGVTIVCAICDEVAFWDSQGVNPDKEVFQALRPAMATIPTAKLLAISSPYAKFGVLFEAHRQYYGRDDAKTLIWQAGTAVMNPNISQELIDQEIANDPEAGRSEWLGLFREDVEAAFSLEMLEACTVPGRKELMPAESVTYFAFADPSGGRGDSWAQAIAHKSGDKVVIDAVHSWRAPFSPDQAAKEAAAMLKPFRILEVTGDHYAGDFPPEAYRKNGIEYRPSEKNRSELYLGLIPIVNSKRIELLDDRQIIDQFRRLERRRARSGKDSIDHPQNPNLHDDLSNVVAGVAHVVSTGATLDMNSLQLIGERRMTSRDEMWDSDDRNNGSAVEKWFDDPRRRSRWNW